MSRVLLSRFLEGAFSETCHSSFIRPIVAFLSVPRLYYQVRLVGFAGLECSASKRGQL